MAIDTPTERLEIAGRISAFAVANHLNESANGCASAVHMSEFGAGRRRKFYGVHICVLGSMSGTVRVFSPGRIQVFTVGPAGFGSVMFASEQRAIEFLELAFVVGDRAAARKLSIDGNGGGL